MILWINIIEIEMTHLCYYFFKNTKLNVTVCFHSYEFQQAKPVCSNRYQKSVCLGKRRAGEEKQTNLKRGKGTSGLVEMFQPRNIAGEGRRGTG